MSILGWISFQVSHSSHFSREVWHQTNFLTFCARQVKGSNDHKRHYAQILATAALTGEELIDFHSALIEKHFREVLTQMSDALREQFRIEFDFLKKKSFYLFTVWNLKLGKIQPITEADFD